MNDSYYWSTIIDAVTEIADGYAAEAKSRHSMTRTFGDETFQGFEECPRGETDDDELAKNSEILTLNINSMYSLELMEFNLYTDARPAIT